MRKLFLAVLMSALGGCVGRPDNVTVVEGFDANRYVGKWYEIARLENRFEKGLQQVTAEYRPRNDGGLTVVNRGYDPINARWKESTGKAYLVGSPTQGQLKVSFFWPFYGAYNIIGLDENYGWAMVCGPDYTYLWILSRAPELPEPILSQLISQAKSLGFKTDDLIFVKHD